MDAYAWVGGWDDVVRKGAGVAISRLSLCPVSPHLLKHTRFGRPYASGEKQRISFARVFWTKPRIVVMDESTSALDLNHEAQIMQRCAEMGFAMLSIAHR